MCVILDLKKSALSALKLQSDVPMMSVWHPLTMTVFVQGRAQAGGVSLGKDIATWNRPPPLCQVSEACPCDRWGILFFPLSKSEQNGVDRI